MGIIPPTKPAAPPRKAILVGGECDGRIVRLNFAPPEKIVVLVEDTDPDAVVPQTAYIAPQDAFPTAAVGRPVGYVLHTLLDNDGDDLGFSGPQELPATRLAFYLPEVLS